MAWDEGRTAASARRRTQQQWSGGRARCARRTMDWSTCAPALVSAGQRQSGARWGVRVVGEGECARSRERPGTRREFGVALSRGGAEVLRVQRAQPHRPRSGRGGEPGRGRRRGAAWSKTSHRPARTGSEAPFPRRSASGLVSLGRHARSDRTREFLGAGAASPLRRSLRCLFQRPVGHHDGAGLGVTHAPSPPFPRGTARSPSRSSAMRSLGSR